MTTEEILLGLKKLCKYSTPVVNWYSHPKEIGNIRGPYNRWFNLIGEYEELIQNNKIVRASGDNDIIFCTEAMNNMPKLIDALEIANIRIEGIILSLQKHGQNIDPAFHIEWLIKAQTLINKALKGES